MSAPAPSPALASASAVWSPGIALSLALAIQGAAGVAASPAHAVITSPVTVPLQWAASPDNPSIRKLGLLASLNGGQPQLFEFDTGGSGFYATYGAGSTWWGSPPSCSPSPCQTFSTTYDSGLTYSGTIVTSSVTLFGGSPALPLLNASGLVVGQTTAITCNPAGTCASKIGQSGDSGWTANTGQLRPPVQGNFYGDFGLSLKPASGSGVNSLITQDAFWAPFAASIQRGYRVHAATANPWVQFGLSAADLVPRPLRFALNASGGTSVGTLLVSDGFSTFAGETLTTLIFDTGATTTIHTGSVTIDGDPFAPGTVPCSLTSEGCPFPTTQPNSAATPPPPFNATTVISGAQVHVSGLSLSTGQTSPILNLIAGTTKTTSPAFNAVAVQGYSTASSDLAPACAALAPPQPCYYLNTGILPFLNNDIIVNLSSWSPSAPSGELTLVPQVPTPAPLLAPVAGIGAARRLRRRVVQRRVASRSSTCSRV